MVVWIVRSVGETRACRPMSVWMFLDCARERSWRASGVLAARGHSMKMAFLLLLLLSLFARRIGSATLWCESTRVQMTIRSMEGSAASSAGEA